MYKSDRHRCEISFLSRLVHLVVMGGMEIKDKAYHMRLTDIAYKAAMEPLNALFDKEVTKIKRRVGRMEELTIKHLDKHSHGEEIVLILYYFINKLQDYYMEIPEESHLRYIVDYLLSLIYLENPLTKTRLSKATLIAEEWLKTLNKEGYYV